MSATATPLNGWRPRHLSHSSVDRFERCPQSWYDSYYKGNRFTATRPMLIGSLFGKLIEDIHNGVDVGDDEAVKHYMALSAEEKGNLHVGDTGMALRMADFYRTSGPGYPYVGTPEYEFLVYLPDCADGVGPVPYPIKGFFDVRRTHEPIIDEFKTGKSATHPVYGWSQQRVNTSPQAAIYWYADSLLNGRNSLVRYTILGWGNDRISMIHLDTRPDMRRVVEFRDKAAKLCEAIESEAFPCTCLKCRVEDA